MPHTHINDKTVPTRAWWIEYLKGPEFESLESWKARLCLLPTVSMARGPVETEFPEAPQPASLAYSMVNNKETLSQGRR